MRFDKADRPRLSVATLRKDCGWNFAKVVITTKDFEGCPLAHGIKEITPLDLNSVEFINQSAMIAQQRKAPCNGSSQV